MRLCRGLYHGEAEGNSMKLISLNIWGGNEFDALFSFLSSHAENTDIFCFQEVFDSPLSVVSRGTRVDILKKLEKIFPGHQSFFSPIQDAVDENGAVDIPSTFGQALFIKKNLIVEKKGFVFAYRGANVMQGDDWGTLGAGFQYAQMKNGAMPLTVVGVHGTSRPGNKLDTPDRLAQSQKILDFLKNIEGRKIVCGDFNLMPQTQSIKMLEANMKNLIKEYDVRDTRGEINIKKYPDDPQWFADYVFVSPDINVISFEVPNIPVSDHLPLVLEFS